MFNSITSVAMIYLICKLFNRFNFISMFRLTQEELSHGRVQTKRRISVKGADTELLINADVVTAKRPSNGGSADENLNKKMRLEPPCPV